MRLENTAQLRKTRQVARISYNSRPESKEMSNMDTDRSTELVETARILAELSTACACTQISASDVSSTHFKAESRKEPYKRKHIIDDISA